MAKILIIEDEKMLINAYKMILERAGHQVDFAENGEDGLKIAETFNPDLILLDLLMPIMDGLAFLKAYDILNKHPNVKVIVFSNVNMKNEAEQAFKLGAKKYLLKAWASPKDLLRIVDDVLKNED